ncbi:hypothetical protein BOO88_10570 [Stutzerimonas stutzeri]|nr:hypothetical protein BOO89_08320 [Stutzerimonas stutzeri]AZO89347.1 hypothetical protein BOO88_10570 [Stutzerimonas stutzeri]
MLTENANPGSKLTMAKKVLWWGLGTAAAVPLTKWVESQLSLSIFSPAISGLWNLILDVGRWLGQSASIPVWILVAITVYALFMSVAFVWAIIDANAQLDACDADLNAAMARIKVLENPPKLQLSDNAHEVVMWVAALTISNMTAYSVVLVARTELDSLQVATALDELQERGLVESDDTVDLTPKGRVYVQRPENLSRSRKWEKAPLADSQSVYPS